METHNGPFKLTTTTTTITTSVSDFFMCLSSLHMAHLFVWLCFTLFDWLCDLCRKFKWFSCSVSSPSSAYLPCDTRQICQPSNLTRSLFHTWQSYSPAKTREMFIYSSRCASRSSWNVWTSRFGFCTVSFQCGSQQRGLDLYLLSDNFKHFQTNKTKINLTGYQTKIVNKL